MALARTLDSIFDDAVKMRGRSLYASGAVHIKDAGLLHIYGQVRGGSLYDVRLTFEDDELLVWCDCGYFEDRGPCKHLWAMILAGDAKGVPADAPNPRFLNVKDEFSFDEDEDDAADDNGGFPFSGAHRRPVPPPPPRIPAWADQIGAVERKLISRNGRAPARERVSEVWYIVDVQASGSAGRIVVDMLSRSRKRNGDWTDLRGMRLTPEQAGCLPDPVDADIAGALLGAQEYYPYQYYASPGIGGSRSLPHRLACALLPRMGAAGRLHSRANASANAQPVAWDGGEPWRLRLEVRQDDRDQWNITGVLARAGERMPLSEPELIVDGGFVLARGKLARFDPGDAFAWVEQLRDAGRISFSDRDRDAVLDRLLNCPALPPMELDAPLQFEERRTQPRLGLRVGQQKNASGEVKHVARLLLDYGRGWVEGPTAGRGLWLPEERAYLLRDAAAERAAEETLRSLGLKPDAGRGGAWPLPAKHLPRVVRELIRAAWHVEAEGKAFRSPGAAHVAVSSGIDWFELRGEVDYGGATASLPQLLAAMRRGDSMVVLGDGTFGLLPEEWLQRFAPLAGLGAKAEDHLRFCRNQAGLLDALLAAQPDVRVDQVFARLREQMRRFQGIQAAPQPDGFVGQLRGYQREGLGWMEFLREFGFGGCLADDMGVGKTAQVLAMLEARRTQGQGPSLVVAPKSLMFNWREEAARFTPGLRVLEHIGAARDEALIAGYDLALTTYGTLLRDAPTLSQMDFDYVVLDEAQAVKNASTASAKAVRLLRGRHRLALSGTPVENHLGELWSLFEFLNPGMLGEAKVLKLAGGLARNPGEEARRLLAQALRPFILRRTKQQVARELPEKTEQTIFCELEGAQRKHYDELRRHYRAMLLSQVDQQGMGRSKMHVLEALLRLRQAACHPGLLDSRRADEPSAKIDTLLAQLAELREENHKALVFSQFTSLLAIVRRSLDAAGVRYEYLDGATRDRQTHVDAFQNDPDCGLFLISLKAGGLGLNLTAAEYVFLLDPWWNPAVEAQAVDRAHRIGQTRPVFAYRLIARDTVEEKVLELQKTKRALADAILGEDNSLIRDLKREDLELLLS
jgi:superfamily II DNA or RNA helicase